MCSRVDRGTTHCGGRTDPLYGNAGDDLLFGGNRNDVLDGGMGSDTIDGGRGYDIANFGARSSYSVSHDAGGVTVTKWSTGEKDTVSSAEQLWFSDALFFTSGAARQTDFSGDGKADVLVHSLTDGAVQIRTMSGSTVVATSAANATAGTDWMLVGSGDFNGDRMTDLLWQDVNGALKVELLNGLAIQSSGAAGTIGADWAIS